MLHMAHPPFMLAAMAAGTAMGNTTEKKEMVREKERPLGYHH